MTKSIFTKVIIWSSISSLVVTLSHLIPFNIPVLLLFVPVTFVFPQLSQTGAEVTYGFAWLQIHAFWVWVVLFVWHFILICPLVFLVLMLRKPRQNK